MRLYKAAATTVKATESTLNGSVLVTVAPAAAAKFSLSAASTTPAAGAEDNLTTTAQDTYGNTATAFTGSHSVVFSGASNSPGGNVPTVDNAAGAPVPFGTETPLTFTAGVAVGAASANGAMVLYKSGSTTVKVTEGALTGTAAAVTVAPGAAAKFSLSAASTTPVVGVADNLTTTAQDTYGNTATTYTGAHSLTFSGASSSPAGTAPTVADSGGTAVNFGTATSLTFTTGVATVASSKNGVLKLSKSGATTVSATDGTISTATGLALTASAAAAARWAFTNVALSAGSAGSPCLFTCTVTGVRAATAEEVTHGHPHGEHGHHH